MNVLLGVTGGIAAYKSAGFTSLLKKHRMEVDVVMTEAAERFVSPLTFETLSKNAVADDLFSRERPYEVEHIALAKKADIAVLAPATANTIAKLACGVADNMLTTVFLALACPVVVVPAMNTAMWNNIAVQVNLQILKDRGFWIMQPDSGPLACGDTGTGRMREPQEIFDFMMEVLKKKLELSGKKVLITAGPTCEAIDPVRYITNRSSGKMGYALAEAARDMGAEVVLVSGPVGIARPAGVSVVDVRSAREMHEAVMERKRGVDIVIACAAVADYTPESVAEHKMKKQEELTIRLVKTKDILEELGREKSCYLVGFAAETRQVGKYARDKLQKKNLDMIVANDVSGQETGFDSDYNAVTILKRDGEEIFLEKDTKQAIAESILHEIAKDIAGKTA